MLLGGSQRMRGYGQVDEDLDEYEDELEDQYGDVGADQYEDEEEYEEEEHEEEEEAPITEEKLRYLDLRQKLKEEARSKIRKENGANSSHDRKTAAPLGKFGSFFGPSKPVIADRVIQESKSLLETRHLAAKQPTSQSDGKKATVTPTSVQRNGGSTKPFPNQVKSKAQMIKQNRDFYSSLLSDDVQIPKSDPHPQKNLAPKNDARSAQVRAKGNEPSSSSSRKELNGQRKPSGGIPHSRSAPPSQKLASGSRASLVPSDSKRQLDVRKQPLLNKQMGISNGSNGGPVRSVVPKVLPPKKPLSTSERKAPVGAVERKASAPVGNKVSTVAKNSMSNGQRLPPVKSQTSIVSNRLDNKGDIRHNGDGKILKKGNIPAPRHQTMKPIRQDPSRSNLGKDQHIKKPKPSGDYSVQRSGPANKDPYNKKRRADEAFSDEEFDYRSMIRGMFGRPRHYDDVDDEEDDDMCMEVGFDAIQKEEMRSARIARKEDEEELIKIMEEERRERLRKQAKLCKNQR